MCVCVCVYVCVYVIVPTMCMQTKRHQYVFPKNNSAIWKLTAQAWFAYCYTSPYNKSHLIIHTISQKV